MYCDHTARTDLEMAASKFRYNPQKVNLEQVNLESKTEVNFFR